MGRATSLAELKAQTGFMTEQSLATGLAFDAKPSDVFISPYSKCGTTWMQQIVHGLRSGGSMAFEEITEVVPWLELAHDMGADLDAPQVAQPRAFKSHLRWDDIPKGGRYIVVLRDPVDAMVSLMRFLEGWFFEAGAISLTEFAGYYLDRGSDGYWEHAASWLRVRDREDVLLVSFEEMKRNLTAVVDLVADHMMQSYGAPERELAVRQAEFSFMRTHADQFDDRLVRRSRDTAMGFEKTAYTGKVVQGRVKAEVSDDIRAAFDLHWKSSIGAAFGYASYDDLCKAL